ncbi:metal-dependent hydrolase [Haloprofundus salinisoli]|uniref:metal-dependent hydrolase n=1 Tax=Haloprofundus salinisoli TaxID=2876193 RepID=UPI001CCD4594|nr:metal-dependent hydrolase [Haloprofundus salinisoli]
MNKKGHVLNAALLSIGLGYVLEPSGDVPTFVAIAELSVPLVLGALFPDVDTAFGKHRKTLHNLPILGIFVAFPILFDNLHFVWVGILTHYVLDLFGSRRGLAFFYPHEKEYSLPFGVTTSSKWADLVTVLITLAEVALFAAIHYFVVPLNGGLNEIVALVGF